MKTFLDKQTYDDYFLNSRGVWKVCNKPKTKPDYISYKRTYKLC